MAKYRGSDWIKSALKKDMSPFGETVADILGDVFGGIYHLAEKSLRQADWANPDNVEIYTDQELATTDSNALTRLVVLCHDRCVRLRIRGKAPAYVALRFSRRDRSDNLFYGHPTLEDNVARIREHYAEAQPVPGPKEQSHG